MIFLGLGHNVDGAVLDFEVSLGQVLAHDAGAEQLHTAAQQDDADHAGPAGGWVTKHQRTDNYKNNADERQDAEQHAHSGGDEQRRGGEADDALDGVFKESPEVPLGGAGHALDVLVIEPLGFEADPAENTLAEAVILGHAEHGVGHFAAHQAEITRAVDNFRVRHLVDDLVELAGAVSGKIFRQSHPLS